MRNQSQKKKPNNEANCEAEEAEEKPKGFFYRVRNLRENFGRKEIKINETNPTTTAKPAWA